MIRTLGLALALELFVLCPCVVDAETPPDRPGMARELLQGCMKPPSQEAAAQLAAAIGAKPYSEVRRKQALKTDTAIFEEPATGRDQRTRTTITKFQGWDLAGPGAGALEYQEQRVEIDWLDRASRQPLTPVRVTLDRACSLQAPVANARGIFELYESLTERPYGIRVAANRRWIDVFMFDEDHFDIELSFYFETPIAGLAPDPAQEEGRLVLSDGGPRFSGGVPPGIPIVKLTRTAFLTGLDRAATMAFVNTQIQPVVQRLAARSNGAQP